MTVPVAARIGGRRRAFTFTEVLISGLILSAAAVTLISLFISAYGQIDKAQTHRRAVSLAEELMCFTRASTTIEGDRTLVCGKEQPLPLQFRTPFADPVYVACGFPVPPAGFDYTIDIDRPNTDGHTGDGEEFLTLPADADLRRSAATLVRRVTVTVLFEGNKTLSLSTFIVNTHAY